MALKIALICLAVTFFFVQLISASPRMPRDAPAPAPAPEQKTDLAEELQNIANVAKSSVDNFLKDVQSNDMYKNITTLISNLGEDITNHGKAIVQKIQKGAPASSN